MAKTPTTAYQSTDLARRSREVVDGARAGGVLVRDKDGTLLAFGPAADVARAEELLRVMVNHLRMEAALRIPAESRPLAGYSDFAWAAALDEDEQEAFLRELESTLLVAASGGPIEPVLDLIHDWRTTAEIAADPDLATELVEDLPEPVDVKL